MLAVYSLLYIADSLNNTSVDNNTLCATMKKVKNINLFVKFEVNETPTKDHSLDNKKLNCANWFCVSSCA